MRKNLKEAHWKAGMTQKQVAEYLGITETHRWTYFINAKRFAQIEGIET